MKAAAFSSSEPPISPTMIDDLGLGIGLEAREDVDERRPDDGVPPDSDDSRLADTELCQLVPI